MKILSNKQYNKIKAVHSVMHRMIVTQEHIIEEQNAFIEKQRKLINKMQAQLGVNVDFPNSNERGQTSKQENNTDIFSKF